MNIAILLPTCEAYLPVASFTLDRLDAWWPGHPEVFVCGLAGELPSFGQRLPLTADPRDWVGIVLDAVTGLQERGFEWLYLILDDHPPFGPCNADFLNRLLPENARELGAVQVNLLGWDQFQPQEGAVLGPEHLHWQRNSADFRWKFSLHPGYWHVLSLITMLRQLRSNAPDVRSARAFEGCMDEACRRLDQRFLERTFRVRGDGFAAGNRWFESPALRSASLRLVHACNLASRLWGRRLRAAVDATIQTYLHYGNGPYPLFWSGLVRQGRRHEEALRFLAWSGQPDLADKIRNMTFPLPQP